MEALPLCQGLHLHLQQVILAKFTLQVLDGTDTSEGQGAWGCHREGKETGHTMFGTFAVRVVSRASLLDPDTATTAALGTNSSRHIPVHVGWGNLGGWEGWGGRGQVCRRGHPPPQLPGNHDGHAVTHSFSLCHVVGRQEGAPLCVFNGGPDRLPASSKDHLQLRKPSN